MGRVTCSIPACKSHLASWEPAGVLPRHQGPSCDPAHASFPPTLPSPGCRGRGLRGCRQTFPGESLGEGGPCARVGLGRTGRVCQLCLRRKSQKLQLAMVHPSKGQLCLSEGRGGRDERSGGCSPRRILSLLPLPLFLGSSPASPPPASPPSSIILPPTAGGERDQHQWPQSASVFFSPPSDQKVVSSWC